MGELDEIIRETLGENKTPITELELSKEITTIFREILYELIYKLEARSNGMMTKCHEYMHYPEDSVTYIEGIQIGRDWLIPSLAAKEARDELKTRMDKLKKEYL